MCYGMYQGAGLQKYKRYNTIQRCVGIRIAEAYWRVGYPSLYIRDQDCRWEREGIRGKEVGVCVDKDGGMAKKQITC